MYHKKLFLFILVVFFILPLSIFSATEVSYPNIPGAISPQNIVQQAENEKDVLPLFLTYIFNILLIVSTVVAVVVIIYGSFLFLTASDDPERKQDAKKWILSAFQGATIVLLSYTILFALDSRLVLFQSRNLDKTDRPEEINMEWDLKTPYFQIPLGLLIEDAALNNETESKFNDVEEATKDAEVVADNIVTASKQLLALVKMCPNGMPCLGEAMVGDINQMAEDFPHIEGGVGSWRDILSASKEDPDFFERFSESWEDITGNPMTKEKVMEKVAMEEEGHDLSIEVPAGARFVSSGIDNGEVFNFTGVIDEPVTILRNPSLHPFAVKEKTVDGRTYTLVGTNPDCGNPIYVVDGDGEDNGETAFSCTLCPEINPPILAKITEIERHIIDLEHKLARLIETKNPLKEDLYNLYKALMIKSLGYENVINYLSLLSLKMTYEDNKIIITTDKKVTTIDDYIWDWSRWINNITYQIEIDGDIIKENDPFTFYLPENTTKEIIEDATLMAKKAKENDIQSIGKMTRFFDGSEISFLEKLKNAILSYFNSFVYAEEETIEYIISKCIEEKELNSEELSLAEVLEICEIDIENKVDSPADYLSCSGEIPVGETVELVWNHLIEILNTIDLYVETAKRMIEQQHQMNALSAGCFCPCEGGDGVIDCGACEITCDVGAIEGFHQAVLETRDELHEIAAKISLLTSGHFIVNTEDLCDKLNEDVKSEEEENDCTNNRKILITNHELITRKLNYSRAQFDNCVTLHKNMEDVLLGKKESGIPIFGPLVEKNDLPRYTKSKDGEDVINTSDFNWFCCTMF